MHCCAAGQRIVAVTDNPWEHPIDFDDFLEMNRDRLVAEFRPDVLRWVLVKAQVHADWFESHDRAWAFCWQRQGPPDRFAVLDLDRLLSRIPPLDRRAIELRADLLDDAQIAELLGMDPTAVRPVLRHARQQAARFRQEESGH